MKQNILFIVLFISGMTYAASICSQNAYRQACQKCPIDQFGKMNETCYQGYTNGGQGCITSAYPVMAGMYAIGQCPAIGSCIDNIQLCKNLYTTGNDREDCNSYGVQNCFKDADACLAASEQNCSTTNSGTDVVLGYIDQLLRGLMSLCGLDIILLAMGIFAVYFEHSSG